MDEQCIMHEESVSVDRKRASSCVDIDENTNKRRSALNFMIYQRYVQATLDSTTCTDMNGQRNRRILPAMGRCRW